jgi:hypothetical protein
MAKMANLACHRHSLRSQLAKNSANSSISNAPFAKNRNLGDLTFGGKKRKKANLAQQLPVFAAAGGGAAAVEGELLRKGKVPRCEFQVKDTTRPLIHLQESNFSTKVLYVSSSSYGWI